MKGEKIIDIIDISDISLNNYFNFVYANLEFAST
jgi:hypothetical protein